MKKIVGVYRHQQQHWVGDGFPVRSLFSYDKLGQAISPFLLLDYAAPYAFTPTTAQRGVGSHPHRGFETVTLAYNGAVTHKDSHGGGGTIQSGDVQWMTAGSGLVHEEFHSVEFAEQGGLFEMVQLWINLPAQHKMTAPRYQAITQMEIPRVELPNQAGHIRVIAGEYQTQHGPASTFSPVNVWDGELFAEHAVTLQVPQAHNTMLVVLQGDVVVNTSQEVADHSMVLFDRDGDTELHIQAKTDAKFLVLTGEPLNEPIQGYGPFVMNTKQEIIEAFDDFNSGKFGSIVQS